MCCHVASPPSEASAASTRHSGAAACGMMVATHEENSRTFHPTTTPEGEWDMSSGHSTRDTKRRAMVAWLLGVASSSGEERKHTLGLAKLESSCYIDSLLAMMYVR